MKRGIIVISLFISMFVLLIITNNCVQASSDMDVTIELHLAEGQELPNDGLIITISTLNKASTGGSGGSASAMGGGNTLHSTSTFANSIPSRKINDWKSSVGLSNYYNKTITTITLTKEQPVANIVIAEKEFYRSAGIQWRIDNDELGGEGGYKGVFRGGEEISLEVSYAQRSIITGTVAIPNTVLDADIDFTIVAEGKEASDNYLFTRGRADYINLVRGKIEKGQTSAEYTLDAQYGFDYTVYIVFDNDIKYTTQYKNIMSLPYGITTVNFENLEQNRIDGEIRLPQSVTDFVSLDGVRVDDVTVNVYLQNAEYPYEMIDDCQVTIGNGDIKADFTVFNISGAEKMIVAYSVGKYIIFSGSTELTSSLLLNESSSSVVNAASGGSSGSGGLGYYMPINGLYSEGDYYDNSKCVPSLDKCGIISKGETDIVLNLIEGDTQPFLIRRYKMGQYDFDMRLKTIENDNASSVNIPLYYNPYVGTSSGDYYYASVPKDYMDNSFKINVWAIGNFGSDFIYIKDKAYTENFDEADIFILDGELQELILTGYEPSVPFFTQVNQQSDGEEDALVYDLEIKNKSDYSYSNVGVYIAFYNENGSLENVMKDTISVDTGEELYYPISILKDEYDNAAQIRVYLWTSDDKFRPLSCGDYVKHAVSEYQLSPPAIVTFPAESEYSTVLDETVNTFESFNNKTLYDKWYSTDNQSFASVEVGDIIRFMYNKDNIAKEREDIMPISGVLNVLNNTEPANQKLYDWTETVIPTEGNGYQTMKFDYRANIEGATDAATRVAIFNVSIVDTENNKLYVTKTCFEKDNDNNYILDDNDYEVISITEDTKFIRMDEDNTEVTPYVWDTTEYLSINDIKDAKNYGPDCATIAVIFDKDEAAIILMYYK